MTDTVLPRVAALKIMAIPDLKARWRELFDTEPPPYNRRFLESRLAYRIQELAYGGLKPETLERLKALGKQFESSGKPVRRRAGRTARSPARGSSASTKVSSTASPCVERVSSTRRGRINPSRHLPG